MQSVICTLFEGNYHYGVAALVNSLYTKGFRGHIYAGYRGYLPKWAEKAKKNDRLNWPSGKTLYLDDCFLHFLPLENDYHLTNYKPDFMLELLDGPAKNAEAIFYFDPDIIQIADWEYMEEWVNCGIALCEDVNSPLEKFHPKRVFWRNYFKGFDLTFKNNIYANGGFVGLNIKDIQFLESWKKIQEEMAPNIGGLGKSKLSGTLISGKAAKPYAPFSSSDQDALNAAIEAVPTIYSLLHKEAMGFENGLNIMLHALGKNKPWNTNFIKRLLVKGFRPRMVDKAFTVNLSYPINISRKFTFKPLSIKISSFLSRFYKN